MLTGPAQLIRARFEAPKRLSEQRKAFRCNKRRFSVQPNAFRCSQACFGAAKTGFGGCVRVCSASNPQRFSPRFETRSHGWRQVCGVKRARARQVISAACTASGHAQSMNS